MAGDLPQGLRRHQEGAVLLWKTGGSGRRGHQLEQGRNPFTPVQLRKECHDVVAPWEPGLGEKPAQQGCGPFPENLLRKRLIDAVDIGHEHRFAYGRFVRDAGGGRLAASGRERGKPGNRGEANGGDELASG